MHFIDIFLVYFIYYKAISISVRYAIRNLKGLRVELSWRCVECNHDYKIISTARLTALRFSPA